MTYFVTGATGFIGSRLAHRLLQEEHHVVAVVRDPARARALADAGATLVRGDITDRESMHEAMRGVDGIFHLAAWYKVGQRDSSMAERINVGGTRNVLELALELAVPKVVYTSTLAVNSDTHGKRVDESYRFDPTKERFLSEYDRTKWLAHYQVALPLLQKGLPLVIVMPGVVYGPGDTSAIGTTLRRYLQGKLPAVPRGAAYSWAHVDDIVTGHILAMEKGRVGETYIIAGPTHTLLEALELAERVTGVKAPRLRLQPTLMKGLARVMEPVSKAVALPEAYHPETLRASAGVTYIADNGKAKRELGYAPRGLEAGLRETLRDEMAQLGMAPPKSDDSLEA